MEWHDGPSLYEVDQAMASLTAEQKAEASRIVADRIRKSYDPYLGRAAELLGTEECRAALDSALSSPSSAHSASNIARNLLATGRSAEAVDALRAIVMNAGLHWGDRIDALVNLKIALGAAGDKRPVSEFITPELEAAIFEAVGDDDYLVRYHAADALLKASGERRSSPSTGSSSRTSAESTRETKSPATRSGPGSGKPRRSYGSGCGNHRDGRTVC